MEMMTPMSVIRLLPASGSQQKDFSTQLLRMVQSGEVNPLEMEIYLKAMADVVADVRKDSGFKSAVLAECESHPEKEFRHGNAIIVKSSRTTYTYKADPTWNELDHDKRKREQFLKSLDKAYADPETGEMIEPAIPSTTEFLKIRYDDYNE